jgi:outer membrane murein-binding lipoprotein Lpp
MKTWKMFVGIVICAVAFILIAGCDEKEKNKQPTAVQDMQDLEKNQKRLMNAVKSPELKNSLAREAIARRLKELDQKNAISYIYLLSDSGKVVTYYTVSGVVQSLNSYLTAMEQVVEMERKKTVTGNNSTELVTLEAPDNDGTFGKNVDGIFFFTTEGARVEWNGKFLWATQPLKLSQQPELIQVLKDKTPAAEAP